MDSSTAILALGELERLARSASPGPWDTTGTCEVFGPGGRVVAGAHHEADARFVAALNPERVLQLLELIRALSEANASLLATKRDEPPGAPPPADSSDLPVATCSQCGWRRLSVHDDEMRCAEVAFALGEHLQAAHHVERLSAITSASRWLADFTGPRRGA